MVAIPPPRLGRFALIDPVLGRCMLPIFPGIGRLIPPRLLPPKFPPMFEGAGRDCGIELPNEGRFVGI